MPKRARSGSASKPLRLVPKSKVSPATKFTVCLALFLAVFLITTGLGFWVGAPVEKGPDPLALELGPTQPCLAAGLDADIKTEEIESLRRDSVYFISTYTLLFVLLGVIVYHAPEPTWFLGFVIILLALFAAQCDFLENHYLDSCLDGNQAAAQSAYAWSCWKWAALAVALAAASPLFLAREDVTKKIGFLLAASGVVGLMILASTGKAELVVRYLFVPCLTLSFLGMAGSFAADLFVPSQRAAHWQEHGR